MTPNQHIGSLITQFRELHGITQADLAEDIGTSQSAIARIEKGDQNLTIDMIEKISEALHKPLLSLTDGSLNFRIHGGKKLSGTVQTNTSKNAAMALMAASLLNRGRTLLKNMPRIEEVFRMIEVFQSIGVSVKWQDNDLEIRLPEKLNLDAINREAATKTRSVIMMAGPLLHLFNDFTLPNAGGCKLGTRTIRPHLYALERLGVTIEVDEAHYRFVHTGVQGNEIVMYESGDTATNNIILAAAKTPGTTTIKFASSNYMVQDLCFFLQSLGVKIEGIGTTTLVIHGVENINLHAVGHPSEDPTESMFFIAAAAVTKSTLTITRCPIEFLEIELLKLEKMGLRYTRGAVYKARNGDTDLVDLTLEPSTFTALEEKIYSRPYPGLNIDNLPFFAVIATQAAGTTEIRDWVYEKRALYFTELDRLGANTILADPHRIFITGVTPLTATELVCPPALRPATIILIGMLAAEGESILRNVYSINRGYENLVTRLNALGADIAPLHDMR